MVEAKESSLPFYKTMPTRLGTAIVLAYYDYKQGALTLMQRLSRGSAKHLKDNETILDEFWLDTVPLKFNDYYIGNQPGRSYIATRYFGEEFSFPSRDTKRVPTN